MGDIWGRMGSSGESAEVRISHLCCLYSSHSVYLIFLVMFLIFLDFHCDIPLDTSCGTLSDIPSHILPRSFCKGMVFGGTEVFSHNLQSPKIDVDTFSCSSLIVTS